MTRIVIADNVVGRQAVQMLEIEYFKRKSADRPRQERDDVREAICLAKGWEFKP